ncbi:uroporphyrinogen III methyltransferase [Cellvibrio zantedeschiae]|uniref:Uroporphyrinogen-III synthase n=1 Tax=Cellvibrio zantedeschiae TaxID=1237077 RepID=A0ABQ3BAS0_9GAMM|nr:uroporphyrinogen-III synthase [Cellvibrio zantedeschiae]GGY82066.1 uroporphyrinogen III methyltransferase [Cellvibrio zantedeschiae]
MDDLTGLHIVVTRPQAQAKPWAERLRAQGAKTSLISLLEIVPVSEEPQVRAIKNRILDFDLYSKAIFVSQNAVEHGFEWLENYWPQLPYGVDFFAVGETTARQLQERGVRVTDLAQSQTGAMTSETLLQSPALQSVTGERILVFRGLGGRPHIGEVLRERGAQVDYCELYQRILPAESGRAFAQLLTQTIPNLVVVLHSGEALENLQKIVRQMTVTATQVMLNMHLLVPSQRILELAKAAGFPRVYAAQNATEASMLQGLLDLKREYSLSENTQG